MSPSLALKKIDMEYKDGLSGEDRARYEEKLRVIFADSGLEITDIYNLPDESWKDDDSLWPPLEFGQIHVYLIDTPGPYTREKMRAYKSLEAYNYYIR